MPTPKNTPPPVAVEMPPDLKRLHETVAFHAATHKELSLVQSRLEREYTALIGRHAEEITQLLEAKQTTLAVIEDLVRQNPGWMGEKRTLKTPYGTIRLTAARSLSIANEDQTLSKLFLRSRRVPDFDATLYFRSDVSLDKEALEKLPDPVLKTLGVVRVEEDKFSFKLFSIDLKDALADSVPPQAAAA